MAESKLEWVRVEPNGIVVATEHGAWLHRAHPLDSADPFLHPMTGPGTPATTRGLLDGAIAAAQQAAPPATPPPMTLSRWAWRLCGYYRTTRATPILMAEAAERFAAAGRHALAAYARAKVQDEGGHDRLALRDLRALGYRAEAVADSLVPPTAAALVDYFTELVRADDPVGCLGYAYALERLALSSGREQIERIEALLPPGVHATRCLRVHSALGADARHVDDVIQVAARLSAAERIAIALACHRTAQLCANPPSDGYPSDEWLTRQLSSFTLHPMGGHRPATPVNIQHDPLASPLQQQ
jgi:hypothetical protein